LAIVSSVVPPLTDDVAEEITVPTETGLLITVPATCARTLASSSRSWAMSRFVRAVTTADCALA
jgi:hypothetical protein